jgi:xylulokinase
VAYGVRHNLETFGALGAPVERIVAVGGGTRGDVWTQIVSDVADIVQERTSPRHGAAFGDAFLAGRAAGLLPMEALSAWVRPDRAVVPDSATRSTYDTGFRRYRALYEATADLVHALARAGDPTEGP